MILCLMSLFINCNIILPFFEWSPWIAKVDMTELSKTPYHCSGCKFRELHHCTTTTYEKLKCSYFCASVHTLQTFQLAVLGNTPLLMSFPRVSSSDNPLKQLEYKHEDKFSMISDKDFSCILLERWAVKPFVAKQYQLTNRQPYLGCACELTIYFDQSELEFLCSIVATSNSNNWRSASWLVWWKPEREA